MILTYCDTQTSRIVVAEYTGSLHSLKEGQDSCDCIRGLEFAELRDKVIDSAAAKRCFGRSRIVIVDVRGTDAEMEGLTKEEFLQVANAGYPQDSIDQGRMLYRIIENPDAMKTIVSNLYVQLQAASGEQVAFMLVVFAKDGMTYYGNCNPEAMTFALKELLSYVDTSTPKLPKSVQDDPS